MKQSDYTRYMMNHIKELRIYDNASPELLAYWKIKDRQLQEQLERQLVEEAMSEEEGLEVILSSEVKTK